MAVFSPSANDPAVFTSDRFGLLKDGTGNSYRTVVKANVNGSIDIYSKGTGAFGGDELLFQYTASQDKVDFNEGKFKDKPQTAFQSFFESPNSNGIQFLKDTKTKWYSEAPPNSAKRMTTLIGYKSIAATTPARTNPDAPKSLTIDVGGTQVQLSTPTSPDQSQDPGTTEAPTEFGFINPEADPISFSGENKTYNGSPYRYPLNQPADQSYDYLKIDVVKYQKSGLITGAPGKLSLQRPSERPTTSIATIILPMQPNISDNNGVSWNEDQLNALQSAFAGTAYSAIKRAGSGESLINQIKQFAGDLSQVAGTLAGDSRMSDLIAGYFAGQAVGANVIARTTGAVINNNLELLFQGPKLRSFRYSYRFTPREPAEAKVIKDIIRIFKREMATSHSDTGLFLQTPNIFRLKYIYNNGTQKGQQHPYLNVIKPCALTNFSVNYTPDGTYMTYGDGGSMTAYQVDMEFSELEPIYKEDYENSEGSQGMGY